MRGNFSMNVWCHRGVYVVYTTVHTHTIDERIKSSVCVLARQMRLFTQPEGISALFYVTFFKKKKIQSLWRFFFCLFISNHFFFFWKNKGEPVCVCVWGWQPECVCVWRKDEGGNWVGQKGRPAASIYLIVQLGHSSSAAEAVCDEALVLLLLWLYYNTHS